MTHAQLQMWYAKQPRTVNDDSDDEHAAHNNVAIDAERQASLNAMQQAVARGVQLRESLENNEEPDDVDDLFDDIYDDEVLVQHPYCPGMRCTERDRAVMMELAEAQRELHGPGDTEQAAEAATEAAADDGTDTGEPERDWESDLAELGTVDETALLAHYRNSAIQNVIEREAVTEILFSNGQADVNSVEGEVG